MSNYPATMTGAPHVQLWADEDKIEPQALEQLREISRLPEVVGLRVMPDVHYGKGATVGSVIAMREALAPAAVGVDIGCGVAAVQTTLNESDLVDLHELRNKIEAAIPVGFNMHEAHTLTPDAAQHMSRFDKLTFAEELTATQDTAYRQVGTLGGGNHFIELCADDHGSIWVTLHSGSRRIGKEIADRHITRAKGLEHNAEYGDMAVFRGNTQAMTDYMRDLMWAQQYAAINREHMMNTLRAIVYRHFERHGIETEYGHTINVHHNYVASEQIDGEQLLVTRKGAIRAGKGQLALIPGSMGTGSYIVEGLGNAASYYSASHGAGRRLSRTKARKLYTAHDLAEQTEGVECRKDDGVVDEIPSAYKNIAQVIEDQDNLVRPVAKLRTLLCVKG